MKKTLTRTICAAAAALMLCTSCGKIDDPAPPASGSQEPAATSASSENPLEEQPSTVGFVPTTLSAKPITSEGTGEALPLTAPSRETLTAFADFSGRLLACACVEEINEGENVLVSPESVLMALGMTANGANGETSVQMQKVLAGGADTDTMNSALNYLSKHAPSNNGLTINIANSIWTKAAPDFRPNTDYAQKMMNVYGAEYFNVPFNDATLNDINGWVNNNTKHMIPEILDDMDPNAAAYLINAIAFEAEWFTEYNEDQVQKNSCFTNSKGETEECTMLYSEEAQYFSDGSAQAFTKPYKGGSYAFMGILPNEGVSVSEYVSKLNGESWYKLWDSASSEQVDVMMPEFTYDYDSELKSALSDMGMEIPFTEAADFRGMADYDHDYFFINRVLHKTHIEVDRKGTKAAAATAVEMKLEDACIMEEQNKYIYLDRPFVYAIVDTENGFPLFIGAVNTVKPEIS